MSSTLSSTADSPKSWWPKSPKPDKSPSKLSLNSFASAFGLKSKKHSQLPIHHPPSTLLLPSPSISPVPDLSLFSDKYPNRPPSKSVSSSRSRVDSIEPRTPSDVHREARQSLLTLSDHDPFAGRGITVISSPPVTVDPSRLSIFSNTSLPLEVTAKKTDYNSFPSPLLSPSRDAPLSPVYSRPATAQPENYHVTRPLVLKKSAATLPRKRSLADIELIAHGAVGSGRNTPSKSGSFSTLKEKSSSNSVASARPMRARGMTDSLGSHSPVRFMEPSALSTNKSTKSDTDPPGRSTPCLFRQTSISRLGLPPCAPPKHDLPPPPLLPIKSSNDASGDESGVRAGSGSSSSLSFASSPSSVRDTSGTLSYNLQTMNTLYPTPHHDDKGVSPSGIVALDKPWMTPPTPAPKLKKAISHHSLAKVDLLPPDEADLGNEHEKERDEKLPRKQRSFHQRLPPLPIVARHVSSTPMPSSPSRSQSPVSEQRRGSSSGTSFNRRRLFSNCSHRPSNSQSTPAEDDAQSIFSLRSEQNFPSSSFRPWTNSPTSFGDDNSSESPDSPRLGSKYMPQYIMSPAQMARVEASVDTEYSSPRLRGLSVSTVTSSKDSESITSASSMALSPFSNSSKSSIFPSRSSSLMLKSLNPPRLSTSRPSTSHTKVPSSSRNEQSTFRPSSSPPLPLMSLPPPPRPRARTTTTPVSGNSSLVLQLDNGSQTSLQPSQCRSLLSKVSMDKFLRQPIYKKPSFLEIDDETDHEEPTPCRPVKSAEGSFLDLTRESFDSGV